MPQVTKTLIAAGIVLTLTLIPTPAMTLMGSFVLVAAVLAFLPWAIYSLVRIAIRPAERRSRALRLAIWTATLVIAAGVRSHWDTVAHEEAGAAVSAVQAFKARKGTYPDNLGEAGIDGAALKEKLSLSYRHSEGKAYLFYSQPSMPMVAHHYNFETNAWARQD